MNGKVFWIVFIILTAAAVPFVNGGLGVFCAAAFFALPTAFMAGLILG